MKAWDVQEVIDAPIKDSDHKGAHPLVVRILERRGFKPEDVEPFLNPRYEDVHDPFLFRNMQRVMDRIRDAKEKKERVYVYGDYDADGVTSSTLMVETLRQVGIEQVDVYIPHREKEGYGLNKDAIDYIAKEGATLIVTVDCGTSNVEEVAHAAEKGVDVIIIDHHEEPSKLPDAYTILNPHLSGETYPFKQLAACGVVFKTVQALWKTFDLPAGHEKWFLDLVAIATVADMMPLVGENRVFVTFGLVVLNKSRRPGLQALIESAEVDRELGVYEIGFVVGPRLNAAGRIDHANNAFALLGYDSVGEARPYAEALNRTNIERQSETERMLREALPQAEAQKKEGKHVLWARGDDWQPGVVGLVSGRITDRLFRPSLVVTDVEGKLTGSGRSIPSFNITEALQQCSEYLERFGGHEGACGFTLKSVELFEPFVDAMNRIAEQQLSDDDLTRKLTIDVQMPLEQVEWGLVRGIEALSPFGVGNPRPVFASMGVRVADVSLVGTDGKHMRIKFSVGDGFLTAIAFGFGEQWKDVLNPGDIVDIAYEVQTNVWQGRESMQLKLLDIKHTS